MSQGEIIVAKDVLVENIRVATDGDPDITFTSCDSVKIENLQFNQQVAFYATPQAIMLSPSLRDAWDRGTVTAANLRIVGEQFDNSSSPIAVGRLDENARSSAVPVSERPDLLRYLVIDQ